MTNKETLELVGAFLIFSGIALAMLRFVFNHLQSIDQKAAARSETNAQQIADMREQFVRKDELMVHINRIERGQENLQSGIDRLHQRMDNWTGFPQQKVKPDERT